MMNKVRVILGTLLSLAIIGVALPVAFWFVARWIDGALGFPEGVFGDQLSQLLAGLSWSIGAFWMFWAYSYLIFAGLGSPVEAFGIALEPTRYLVTGGPYAYVRNPVVFGFLFVLLGVAFLAGSISGMVLVPVTGLLAALYLRIFEERELERRFGAHYEGYRENVPLLIPQLRPYVSREAMV